LELIAIGIANNHSTAFLDIIEEVQL